MTKKSAASGANTGSRGEARAAIIVAVIGVLGTSLNTYLNKKTDTRLNATRVELGAAASTNSADDCNSQWQPWRQNISNITQYVGVRRTVRFQKPFDNAPTVLPAINSITLRSLDLVLRDLGYQPADANETDRLRQLAVVAFAVGAKPDQFELQVGVALPTRAAKFLSEHLNEAPKQSTTSDRFAFAGTCKDETNWTIRLYETVGGMDVIWLARSIER